MSLCLSRIPTVQLVTAATCLISEERQAVPSLPSLHLLIIRWLKFTQPLLAHCVPVLEPSWEPLPALTVVCQGPTGTVEPRTSHRAPGPLSQVPNWGEGSLPSACWLLSCQYRAGCCCSSPQQRQAADFEIVEPRIPGQHMSINTILNILSQYVIRSVSNWLV